VNAAALALTIAVDTGGAETGVEIGASAASSAAIARARR
jgi:hypothetical protein